MPPSIQTITLINLLPQQLDVMRHFESVRSTLEPVTINTFHPRDEQDLRRAFLQSADLVYLLGHATVSQGIELDDGFLAWNKWEQLFNSSPRRTIMNACHAQSGMYWKAVGKTLVEGHAGLVKREDAYEWGEEKLRVLCLGSRD